MAMFSRFVMTAWMLASAHAFAGVIVTQDSGPGATTWPATPLLSTLANPSAQAIVGESFAGGGGSTSYGQTFTIPPGSNYKLETIYLYAGGGTGTTGPASLGLNLYYLGGRTAPNPNTCKADRLIVNRDAMLGGN